MGKINPTFAIHAGKWLFLGKHSHARLDFKWVDIQNGL